MGEPKPLELTINNITNKLTKPIITFTVKALKPSKIPDSRQILQSNDRNLANLTISSREPVPTINTLLGKAYKQLSLTPQNKELLQRSRPCYQIFTWEGLYLARKHNIKISSEIET
jgi:hypothetical protein